MACSWVGVGCGRTIPDPIRGADADSDSDVRPADATTDRSDADATDAGPVECDAPDIELVLESSRTNVDSSALLPDLSGSETALVRVPASVTLNSASPDIPAFATGDLPPGVRVCLIVAGRILGAGGAGGSGGNGAPGRKSRPCGRDGGDGGVAVEFRALGRIEILRDGIVGGGGGGGGGASSCELNAGGGGGAGIANGEPGAGWSGRESDFERAFCGQYGGVSVGVPGVPGRPLEGGAGGRWERGDNAVSGGAGGAIGRPGQPGRNCGRDPGGAGGRPGFAIVLGPQPVEIIGPGTIVGPVDF